MFITLSSANNEFLIVVWEGESKPFIAIEIAQESGIVSRCIQDSKPNSFIMDIIGGIKRNSTESIQVDIEEGQIKYYGPTIDEFISELTKEGVSTTPSGGRKSE